MNRKLPERPDGLLRHLVIVFAVALAFYSAAYWVIEHKRNKLGPWQLTFTHSDSGTPEIVIDQVNLSITNVRVEFSDADALPTNETMLVDYAQPRAVPYPVPFGRCLFMDTTTLPGTIVFDLFGHEIQLLPRVLTIDKQERPWRSDERIALPSTNGHSNLPVQH